MAIMIPELSDEQLEEIESKAERKLYTIFKDNLPDSYYVFSQVSWILKKEDREAKDGETDFVICHQKYGYLCIEVKGGGISVDATKNEWFSIDYEGSKNNIKDPIQQVKSAKYSILHKLKESGTWTKLKEKKIGIGHSVFFPDVKDANPFVRADMPIELIGVASNVQQIKKWVEGCFQYWEGENTKIDEMGEDGINVFKSIFAKSFQVSPLLVSYLEETEQRRIKLTKEQIRILDFLKKQRRVALGGGAGTGKTILAVEKAKSLANEGFRTLLTCYNRPLAEHLKNTCKGIAGLDIMDFHQLCKMMIDRVDKIANRNLIEETKITYPGEDAYQILYPAAFLSALEYLEDEEKYDAVICDEGQDFGEEYWMPLEYILTDENNSPFYIFYDDNQNLYSRVSTFPIPSDNSYSLTKNCRNTRQIHDVSYRYYNGDPIESSDINGVELEYSVGNTLVNQTRKIQNKIIKLITEEGISPGSIAILIADAKMQHRYIESLMNNPLPKEVELKTIEDRDINQPVITTVNKFKGLEADIVFLWGIDSMMISEYERYIYVGLSRAKSMAIIVANNDICNKIKGV